VDAREDERILGSQGGSKVLGVLQDRDHGCCFYNKVTGFAFGPVFYDLTEAMEFEKWLRSFDLNPLEIADLPSTLEYYWAQFNRRIPNGV
jgi:hypothetical protein